MFISAGFLFASGSILADDGGETEADGETPPVVKTIYVKMEPSFVTNYGEPVTRKLKYVKADVSLRVSGSKAERVVERHMPNLRNEIVLLLSSQTAEAMASGQAQEAVRKQALKAVNKVLKDEEETESIDDLLFTNFVVQR